jgi:single-strand DNA-binding protein
VVVHGRLYTREWSTEDGQRRTAYELEAVSVGHDLARGVGVFRRGRVNLSTTVVEDAETENRINGELTEPAPEETARSEALVADLREEEVPSLGDGEGEVADLGPIRGEMAAQLNDLIAGAQAQLADDQGTGSAEPAAEEPERRRRARARVPVNA